MIHIYCSHKLAKFLNPLVEKEVSGNPAWVWNAHIFYIQHKKSVIFLNPETAYSCGLTAISKKDFKDINNLFRQCFIDSLYDKHLLKEGEESVFRASLGSVHLLPTNADYRAIGFLNDTIYWISRWWTVEHHPQALEKDAFYLKHHINTTPIKLIDYSYPKEMMQEKLDVILRKGNKL